MAVGTLEHPLFRTLVVCGASLVSVGCGGRTSDVDRSSAGGASEMTGGGGGSSAAAGAPGSGAQGGAQALCPHSCETYSQFTCDNYQSGTNCRCDAAAPRSSAECDVHWDFRCTSARMPPGCAPLITLGPSFGCRCSYELRPGDCARTSDFQCDQYRPVALGCRCDPTAPSGPADCEPSESFRCEEYDPNVGCRCAHVLPIR